MIGIKVNLLLDPIEQINELVEFVGEDCTIELFTEPHHFEKQKQLVEKLTHPFIQKVVIHSSATLDCFSDPLVTKDGYDNCLRQMEIAPAGGGFLIHPFGYGLSPEKRWETIKADLQVTNEFANIGEERNVKIYKENIPAGFDFPHGRSAEDMEFLTRHKNVEFCLDISHQGMMENFSHTKSKDPYYREEFTRYLPHFDLSSFLLLKPHYFHISDFRGKNGEGLELGEGECDFSFLSKQSGIFVLEILGQHKNNFEVWRRNVPILKKILAGESL